MSCLKLRMNGQHSPDRHEGVLDGVKHQQRRLQARDNCIVYPLTPKTSDVFYEREPKPEVVGTLVSEAKTDSSLVFWALRVLVRVPHPFASSRACAPPKSSPPGFAPFFRWHE